jgi:PAS domain S-box-containing protein
MENEPDIVKELKKAERLGQLKSLSQTVLDKEKRNINDDERTVLFKNNLDKINKNIQKSSFENKDSLIESEELYRTIFENSAVAITVTDENEKIISWNKYTEKLLGMTEKDLFLKPVEKLYPAKEWKKIRKENVRQKGMQHHLETKILKNGKKPIDIDISISVLKNNHGSIIGSIGVFKDITEKKRIENELVESENRFRDIFDSTSDFLLYIEKGIILDINKTAEKIGGMKKDTIIGKKLTDLNKLFSKEDMKNHLEAEKNASCGAKVRDYESDLISKDGTRYNFLFSVDSIKNIKGIKGILIRGRDITQRHQAWEELVKLEEKYRVLAETSADGVVIIDSLGRLTYVNPSFEKLCARRKSQVLATLFREYLSDESVYFFEQVFIDVRKKDEKIENVELELVHSKGHMIPIEVNIAPFKKENEFTGMVCTIRDITERRNIEDELKKSERLKTEFMNIAAHELKSPVTPIKGYLDLIISDKEVSNQIKDWAKVSLRNAERLLKLVNDILDVSRLDTDTMRFEMERLETLEILNEIVEDMKAPIEKKGLKFLTKIPNNLPNIMGDRHRLSQVLKNLLGNALKFTDNGYIGIEAQKKEKHLLIIISDTGIGISKDEVKKVFNKFYQAYTGDDRKNEGTGLGLFICKEILHKHEGDIWVESELGKGSQFIIKLPYLHKMVVNLSENN